MIMPIHITKNHDVIGSMIYQNSTSGLHELNMYTSELLMESERNKDTQAIANSPVK